MKFWIAITCSVAGGPVGSDAFYRLMDRVSETREPTGFYLTEKVKRSVSIFGYPSICSLWNEES